jgi:trehalose/maltose hydrolase-like predicted phosphorylase
MFHAGHSFWDTETWMFPFYVLFNPTAARATLDYRLAHMKAARDRAADTGYDGARCSNHSDFD